MKKTVIMIALASVFVACNKGKKETNSNEEKIVIDSTKLTSLVFDEEKYDFGKVTAGEVVEHVFKFKNTGKFPLIIASATASCGCTVPSKPDHPIAPGETGEISVKFNSEGRNGLQEKNITIIANTNPNMTQLRLYGEVN